MAAELRDVTDWLVLADEPAGADDKAWLTPPDSAQSPSRMDWWLFKPVKVGTVKETGGRSSSTYRRNDDRVELIASRLARILGIPAAEVMLGRRGNVEGCLSRYVIPDGWSMASADTLLAEFDGYVPCADDPKLKERMGHNLDNIEALLRGLYGPPSSAFEDVPAFAVFAGFLVFDAWIANTDRHALNWALLYQGPAMRLAPSFDHGSALGSGLREDGLPPDAEAWCHRGYAGRFEGGKSLSLVDLALQAVSRGGSDARSWLTVLAQVTRDVWEAELRGVPGLSVAGCSFMSQVLATNQRRLCS